MNDGTEINIGDSRTVCFGTRHEARFAAQVLATAFDRYFIVRKVDPDVDWGIVRWSVEPKGDLNFAEWPRARAAMSVLSIAFSNSPYCITSGKKRI